MKAARPLSSLNQTQSDPAPMLPSPNTAATCAWFAEVKTLFRLAIPIVATSALSYMMQIVDLAMIGRLGETRLAGSALGNMWFNIWFLPLLGVMTAMETMFSQVSRVWYIEGRDKLMCVFGVN
jgi:Na+-driven multidrug efflux pump